MFHELTKNATDEEDIEKLEECMDASSKISQYVNKAVTECENRKRVNEIQSRMDTKEFDQYCTKSSLLIKYKVSYLLTYECINKPYLIYFLSEKRILTYERVNLYMRVILNGN